MSLPAVNTPPLPLITSAPISGSLSAVVEGFDQRFVHRAGDRVLLLRPGEGRRQDRALAGDLDVFRQGVLGHALSARIAS